MEVKHYIGVRICVGMTARTKQPFQLELGCKSEPQVYQGEKTTIPQAGNNDWSITGIHDIYVDFMEYLRLIKIL